MEEQFLLIFAVTTRQKICHFLKQCSVAFDIFVFHKLQVNRYFHLLATENILLIDKLILQIACIEGGICGYNAMGNVSNVN